MLKKYAFTAVFGVLLTSSLTYGEVDTPAYWEYFVEAGERYSLDPKILLAIGMTESSLKPHAINKDNRNKSIDVGIMQINSWWFKTLKKHTEDLNNLYDPRFNIHVGAWVLKQCTNRYGVTWKAVDCYNKGENNAKNISSYVRMVNKSYMKIKDKNF
ncbi:MAG: lytic transglycosylase domain-containing protein [Epsilonproteobacteria bacterium]|nr:lytic transglycosylase domain-containing protein [Campylobacterota bacterium]